MRKTSLELIHLTKDPRKSLTQRSYPGFKANCAASVLVKMLSNTSYLPDASTPGCHSGRLDSLGSRLRSEAGRVRVKVWSRIRTADEGEAA